MEEMIRIYLDSNDDYKNYINHIFKYVKNIEFVILDDSYIFSQIIMEYLKKNNLRAKNVNSWMGTKSGSRKNLLYRFDSNSEFKNILLKLENFFIINKKEISKNTYSCTIEDTDWGHADIAFFDENNEVISYVTAHEGDILVNEKYIYEFSQFILNKNVSYYFGLWIKLD